MIGFWPACAIGLACSAAAANAPEADTRSARFFQNVVGQLFEALKAPFEQYIGKFNRGKFGVNNSLWTAFFPAAATEALKTANTALIPHHVAGVNGVGFDHSSPFTLGDYSGQASQRAFDHTFTALLLGGDGMINITSAALIKKEKTNTEASNNIRRFQRHAVGLLDAVRWNSSMVSTAVFAGSAGSERG
jgi:hypothetical protein